MTKGLNTTLSITTSTLTITLQPQRLNYIELKVSYLVVDYNAN